MGILPGEVSLASETDTPLHSPRLSCQSSHRDTFKASPTPTARPSGKPRPTELGRGSRAHVHADPYTELVHHPT